MFSFLSLKVKRKKNFFCVMAKLLRSCSKSNQMWRCDGGCEGFLHVFQSFCQHIKIHEGCRRRLLCLRFSRGLPILKQEGEVHAQRTQRNTRCILVLHSVSGHFFVFDCETFYDFWFVNVFFSMLKWIKSHRRANLTKAIFALFGYLETEASSI